MTPIFDRNRDASHREDAHQAGLIGRALIQAGRALAGKQLALSEDIEQLARETATFAAKRWLEITEVRQATGSGPAGEAQPEVTAHDP